VNTSHISPSTITVAVAPRQRINETTLTAVPLTERNGRKTLTTVQGLPKKFDQKKILKVIKKKFGTLPVLVAF
jgi:translation initiation factor 1 (eIF-1/SUI1)